jgi:putative FmdB family regulatory protein
MAYFDYYCDKCKKPFEIKASISDDRSWVKCPKCSGNKIRRVFDSVYVPKKSGGGNSAPSGGSSCSSCASHNCSTCG